LIFRPSKHHRPEAPRLLGISVTGLFDIVAIQA
jgi:hypothetical protein